MENLDFNAGRFGLDKRQLIDRSYDRLTVSAKILGFTISRLSGNGVSVIDSDGVLFKQLSINEMMEGKSI